MYSMEFRKILNNVRLRAVSSHGSAYRGSTILVTVS